MSSGGGKQPIRTRYLGHVTGYQPIRGQYFHEIVTLTKRERSEIVTLTRRERTKIITLTRRDTYNQLSTVTNDSMISSHYPSFTLIVPRLYADRIKLTTNHISLFRSCDWLSANQRVVYILSLTITTYRLTGSPFWAVRSSGCRVNRKCSRAVEIGDDMKSQTSLMLPKSIRFRLKTNYEIHSSTFFPNSSSYFHITFTHAHCGEKKKSHAV
eukprot:sb/3470144/